MGHSIQGIVRFYRPQGGLTEGFSVEERCQRTTVGTLADDDSFELFFDDGAGGQTRMAGRFETTERLTMRLNAGMGQNTEDLDFAFFSEEPNDVCNRIDARRFDARFSGISGANEFEPGVYEIRDPWFGVQWVPVERIQSGGLIVFSGPTPALIATSVMPNMTANALGLQGTISLLVEPPGEADRISSGSTRYSLAHFVVVDDDPDDGDVFGWDPNDDEPLIASGVRKGKRPDQSIEHNRFGRAILFVEGRLDELDPSMMEEYFAGWEDVDLDAHFWVVEVFAQNDRVNLVQFSPGSSREIQVVVSPDFLEDTQLTLPRLFPTN